MKLDVSKIVPSAYHYDVTIDFEPKGREPLKKKTLKVDVFNAYRQQHMPRECLAYDGQNSAFAPKKLGAGLLEKKIVNFVERDRTREFSVELKEVKSNFEINLSCLKK